MEAVRFSAVIPVYNEESILPETEKQLREELTGAFGDAWQIVFSDDGSTDNSGALLAKMAAADAHIRVTGTPENHGKGSAVRLGMLAADGACVLFTDCDLAYGTAILKTACETMEREGCDVLIGTRYREGGSYDTSALRRLMSRCYRGLVRLLTGFSYSDSQCGLKAFSRDAAQAIFSRCEVDRFAFDLEALLIAKKYGYTVAELPVSLRPDPMREGSRVRVVRDTVRMVRDLIRIRRRVRAMR